MATTTDNVVPLHPAAPASTPAPPTTTEKPNAIEQRLTAKLAKSFCAVPSYLIRQAHRLRPHEGAAGLTPVEVLVLIHILDRKWDHRLPHPALTTIATAMGKSVRTVRAAVERLEELKYLQRIPMPDGGPNRYDLSGLFAALERLMDEDAAARDAQAAAAAAPTAAAPTPPAVPAAPLATPSAPGTEA